MLRRLEQTRSLQYILPLGQSEQVFGFALGARVRLLELASPDVVSRLELLEKELENDRETAAWYQRLAEHHTSLIMHR